MPRLTCGVLLLAGTCAVVASLEAGGQRLRESAKIYARDYHGLPLLQVGPAGTYSPKTIEELTREAEIVIHARLARLKSYVGADGERVLSDFAIRDQLLLAARTAGAAAAQGASQPMIVTVYGGEVIVDGVEVQSSSADSAAITDGGEYLLFLKKARLPGAGRYEPYYGAVFSIEQGKVKPLLREGNIVFKDAYEVALPEVVSQIEAAARFR